MNDIGRQTAAILAAHYPADDALLRRAAVIAERLAAVNPHMNLTALTSPEEIALLHIYDSLALRLACDFTGRTVVDVGCGGGAYERRHALRPRRGVGTSARVPRGV